MSRAEWYIKGEESNAEKKARDVKERGNTNSDRINYYRLPPRDRGIFKRQERIPYKTDVFTPLHTRSEPIFKEVYDSKLLPDPP